MTAPIRIQRKRTRGWRMPENTIYVGRPSKWGNPFEVGSVVARNDTNMLVMTVEKAVALFEEYIYDMAIDASELRGKNLACWCRLDQPCHADILLKLANEEPPHDPA